jgi:membrane-associated phospholipid phosphatase
MVLMLTITRVHYTTDIIGGLIFALFCHKVGTITVYFVDSIFSFPLFVAAKIRLKIKGISRD